jgi:hypothetical protein
MGPGGVPCFRALSRLSTTDVADVTQIARARILRLLRRRGVVAFEPEAMVVADGEAAEREPVLSQLAAAAVVGLPPAGPEVRRRPIEIALRGKPGVMVTGPRCVEDSTTWNSQDVERVVACYTDDVAYRDPNTRGPSNLEESLSRAATRRADR